MNHNELYDQFDSIEAIQDYRANASSLDGETLIFEAKGAHYDVKQQQFAILFGKDNKKKLAKEICAFANTEGGVLCFHKGKPSSNNNNRSIVPFSEEEANTFYGKFEDWLKTALNPLLSGADLKICDNALLFKIPKSDIKPHKTTGSGNEGYFFRNVTQSVPMSKEMIARSLQKGDVFTFTSQLEIWHRKINRNDKTFMDIRVTLKNTSQISGAQPKVKLSLYSNTRLPHFFESNENTKECNNFGKEITSIETTHQLYCETAIITPRYPENQLHPDSSLSIEYDLPRHCFATTDNLEVPRYLLATLECCFEDSLPIKEVFLLDTLCHECKQPSYTAYKAKTIYHDHIDKLENLANRLNILENS